MRENNIGQTIYNGLTSKKLDTDIKRMCISDSESDPEDLEEVSQRLSQRIRTRHSSPETRQSPKAQLILTESTKTNIYQPPKLPHLVRQLGLSTEKVPRLVNCFEEAKYQPGNIDIEFLEEVLENDYDSFFQINPANEVDKSDSTTKDPESERNGETMEQNEPTMNGNIINLHSSPISCRLQNGSQNDNIGYLCEKELPISEIELSSVVNRPPLLFDSVMPLSSPQASCFSSLNNTKRPSVYTQAQDYTNTIESSSNPLPRVCNQPQNCTSQPDYTLIASPPAYTKTQNNTNQISSNINTLSTGLTTLLQQKPENFSKLAISPSKQNGQQPSSSLSWSPSQPWHYYETLATLHAERMELLKKKEIIESEIKTTKSPTLPNIKIELSTLEKKQVSRPSRPLENLFSTSPPSSPTQIFDMKAKKRLNSSSNYLSSPVRHFHTRTAVASVDTRPITLNNETSDTPVIPLQITKRVKYEEGIKQNGNMNEEDYNSIILAAKPVDDEMIPVSSTVEKSIIDIKPTNVNVYSKNQESLRAYTASSKAPSNTKKQLLLTAEQQKILKLVVSGGKSIFFTGAAGTGKSVLLRRIIHDLKRKFFPRVGRVGVTASTGLAACNIGGTTLHSFAGVGLGKEPVPDLVKRLNRNKKARTRWRETKVLVIDEVSMVDAEFLDKLDQVGQTVRKNTKPFGGIQVVITGDFYQLPPVSKDDDDANFAFEADCWNKVLDETIELKTVFRQKDNNFARMLNEMRNASLSAEAIKKFSELDRPIETPEGLQATELFPTRYQVDNANRRHLSDLKSEMRTFKAIDTGSHDPLGQNLLNSVIAPQEVSIKVGAQVMMIKNIDESLVNGSLGKVIGFMSESSFKLIDEGLKDNKICDIDDQKHIEDDGYRLPPEGYRYTDEESDDLLAVGRKREHANRLNAITKAKGGSWPYVRFHLADGTIRDVLVQPETWKMEDHDGRLLASRTQIPLILAWALSIHKAQGQTLEYVKVDLNKIFEKGQAYVALSRAVTPEGLQVKNFNAAKVMVHYRVIDFYESLRTVDDVEPPEEVDVSTNPRPLRPRGKALLCDQKERGMKRHITNYFTVQPKVEQLEYMPEENDSSTFRSVTYEEARESALLDEIQ